MKTINTIFSGAVVCAAIIGNANLLDAQTASMVGSSDMREAKIVSVNLKPSGDSPVCEVKSKDSAWSAKYSPVNSIDANAAKVSHFTLHSLLPNTQYEYQISEGGKKTAQGTFKTFPDYLDRSVAPDFSFVAVGNQFTNEAQFDIPFRTNGGEYEIFATIKKSSPSFVLWTDNLDTARPADFGSASGMNARYLTAFGSPKLSDFLASQPNFGVPAMKMFAKRNEDSSAKSKTYANAAFKTFWANPDSPLEAINAYSFSYADAEFFVLDDCTKRNLLDYQKDMPKFLGDEQLKWLESALQNSEAKFKFVVINSPAANPVNSKSHFKISRERDSLISFLTDKKICGVVFISANKEYGEITKMVRANAYPIYDITVPVLTGRPAKETEELNYFRLPNSGVFQRAFAKFSIDGAENARTLTVSFVDINGASLFSLRLKASELECDK